MAYREAGRRAKGQEMCFYCGGLVGPPCQACGAVANREDGPHPSTCRRCGSAFDSTPFGALWCKSCGGVFFEGDAWDATISAIRASEPVDIAVIVPPPPGKKVDLLKQMACPSCGVAMDRATFGARSRITVDVCPRHGLWLDGGELVGVLEFVRRLWENQGLIPVDPATRREEMEERETLRKEMVDVVREREREALIEKISSGD